MNYSSNSILSDRIFVTAENDLWMAAEAHGSLLRVGLYLRVVRDLLPTFFFF